jgi:hypothetical protein
MKMPAMRRPIGHGLGIVRGLGIVDIWGFVADPSDPCPLTHVSRDGKCLTPADLNFNPDQAAQQLSNYPIVANPGPNPGVGTRVAGVTGASATAAPAPTVQSGSAVQVPATYAYDSAGNLITVAARAYVAPAPLPAVYVPQNAAAAAPRLTFQTSSGSTSVIVAGRDTWRLSITGAAPNVPVVATGIKDGAAPSSTTYGTTDAAGNWTLSGSSAAADIGAWRFTWTAGGQVAGNLNFSIVSPDAAPPAVIVPIYSPRLTFSNLTSGSTSVIVAGRDTWRLSITGAAPNAPVMATGRKNGAAPSSTSYGSTDASGNWNLIGSSAAADIGDWTFSWTAGGQVAGNLNLSIVAPAAPAPSTPTPPAPPTPQTPTNPSPTITAGGGGASGAIHKVVTGAQDAVNSAADAAGIPPVWMWSAAAAAALFVFTRKGKWFR